MSNNFGIRCSFLLFLCVLGGYALSICVCHGYMPGQSNSKTIFRHFVWFIKCLFVLLLLMAAICVVVLNGNAIRKYNSSQLKFDLHNPHHIQQFTKIYSTQIDLNRSIFIVHAFESNLKNSRLLLRSS